MVLQHFLQAQEKNRVVKREVKKKTQATLWWGINHIEKAWQRFFNEKFMIRGKLMVKQKLMITDLTVPLNVGEWGGYLALIQSAFLWNR